MATIDARKENMEKIKLGSLFLGALLVVSLYTCVLFIPRSDISTVQQEKGSSMKEGGQEQSSLTNIFDEFISNTRKSRDTRNEVSDSFAETNLCTISADDMQTIGQAWKLSSNSYTSDDRDNVTLNNCEDFIIDIETQIFIIKSLFVASKNMKESTTEFEAHKKQFVTHVLYLKQKVENLLGISSHTSQVQLDQCMETIEQQKSDVQDLQSKLDKERIDHINTRTRFCIGLVKSKEGFSECVDLFQSIPEISFDNGTAFDGNIERILSVLEASQVAQNFKMSIFLYELLLEKINETQNYPLILQVHNSIEKDMTNPNFTTFGPDFVLRYQNAKEESKNLFDPALNIWKGQIESGNYEHILKFENEYPDAFCSVSERLIETVYSNHLEVAGKIINFLKQPHDINCSTIMTSHIINLMKNNSHIFSSEGMQLAGFIKSFTTFENFSSHANNIKREWMEFKNRFPIGIQNIFWTDVLTVKSMIHNEFLYAIGPYSKYDSSRGRLFTWIPGVEDYDTYWIIKSNDSKFFTMFNTFYKEFLYADEDQFAYDQTRRNVFTWIDTSLINDRFYWEIIPKDENNFYIKNKFYGEYLYSDDDHLNDAYRRRVFTWREKEIKGVWRIGSQGK